MNGLSEKLTQATRKVPVSWRETGEAMQRGISYTSESSF